MWSTINLYIYYLTNIKVILAIASRFLRNIDAIEVLLGIE